MNKEFLDFFNQKYIKIIFIGRFMTEFEDRVEYYNVFKKRDKFFVIVEEMPFSTLENVISDLSGFWDEKEIKEQKKTACLLIQKEILVRENSEDMLLTDIFLIKKENNALKFVEDFHGFEKNLINEDEFNKKICSQWKNQSV